MLRRIFYPAPFVVVSTKILTRTQWILYWFAISQKFINIFFRYNWYFLKYYIWWYYLINFSHKYVNNFFSVNIFALLLIHNNIFFYFKVKDKVFNSSVYIISNILINIKILISRFPLMRPCDIQLLNI